ncbi:hypothetical protein IMCC20628_01723 [Hoeflea sp. IMCC20628]|uniref:hypothetical protein n=1 Tax=Hoeflea sp. IMCC20628 TaxID=1620421 RepID=UPI00063AB5A3|nr:hypothetical protein [Hoeflea sp. IMCC20628]AKI00436.1 hypothetical protein IMCC20628_01723 [Hoeflea sp. IMCC20628]
MEDPIDPIKVRQARQGKPVLLILVVSMVLALVAAWVLWGAFNDVEGTTYLPTNTSTVPGVAHYELLDGYRVV